MANIRKKSLEELDTWNQKELRKLRITIKNRIQSLNSFSSKEKTLPDSHPLKGLNVQQCEELLQKVLRTEKSL